MEEGEARSLSSKENMQRCEECVCEQCLKQNIMYAAQTEALIVMVCDYDALKIVYMIFRLLIQWCQNYQLCHVVAHSKYIRLVLHF